MCKNTHKFKSSLTKYSTGNVFWYDNPEKKKKGDYTNNHLDFVVNRPVLIIGGRETLGNTIHVNVLEISKSPRRVGIPIVVNPEYESKILPYKILTINKSNLRDWQGQISSELLLEVKQAVSYHLELTDELPKYLDGFTEEMIAEMLKNPDQDDEDLTDDIKNNFTVITEAEEKAFSSIHITASSNDSMGNIDVTASSKDTQLWTDNFQPKLTTRARKFYDSLTSKDKITISKSTIDEIRVLGNLGMMEAKKIKSLVCEDVVKETAIVQKDIDYRKLPRKSKIDKLFGQMKHSEQISLLTSSISSICKKYTLSSNGATKLKSLAKAEMNKPSDTTIDSNYNVIVK